MNYFLTGTDTGVGKTYVASLLIRAARERGLSCVGLKPICCGGREDAEELWAANDGALSLNQVNPVWLRTPAAPYTAAMVESRAIDLALIRESVASARAGHGGVIVEGVGGWRVPITGDYFIADLAKELNLPVVVVVGNRLGAINHTLLTVDAVQAAGLTCAGLIINHAHPSTEEESVALATNAAMLSELSRLPILFEIAHGQTSLAFALA